MIIMKVKGRFIKKVNFVIVKLTIKVNIIMKVLTQIYLIMKVNIIMKVLTKIYLTMKVSYIIKVNIIIMVNIKTQIVFYNESELYNEK